MNSPITQSHFILPHRFFLPSMTLPMLRNKTALILCLFLILNTHIINGLPHRPKIGLVLSGGGAKGAAHIGVLKVIEEADIPIDYICGTSMGAIVGGLYSIGYNAHELDSIVRSQDWMFLFSDQINRTHRSYAAKEKNDAFLLSIPFNNTTDLTKRGGIMKGQSIFNKFSDLTIGYHQLSSFNQLPIPFSCVATDLVTGREVIMDKGSLPLAMRASMSVPGFFEPVREDSMILVDGGILNNFPVDIMKKMGADIIIGVDVSNNGLETNQYNSLLDVANRLAFLSGEEKYARNKDMVDIYINPGLIGYSATDFKTSAIDSVINKGETAARKVWDKLQKLKRTTAPNAHNRNKASEFQRLTSMYFDTIKIVGLQSYDEEWLKDKLSISNNTSMSLNDIENLLYNLQGLGSFESTAYQVIHDSSGKDILTVSVEEKAKNSINIGIHLDSEDIASVLMQAQVALDKSGKHDATLTTKINQNPWLKLQYSIKSLKMRDFYLSYFISYKDFIMKKDGERIDNITFVHNQFSTGYKNDAYNNLGYTIGLKYDIFSNVSELYTPSYIKYSSPTEDYLNAFFQLNYDTTDDKELPQRGVKINASLEAFGNDIFNEKRTYFGIASFNINGANPISQRITFMPELFGRFIVGEHIPQYFCNHIGGVYDMRYLEGQRAFYGVHFAEIVNNYMLGIRMAFRYRLLNKHYLSAIANYLVESDKFKNMFYSGNYYGFGIKYSYKSAIGPINLSVDYSNRSKRFGFFGGLGYFF